MPKTAFTPTSTVSDFLDSGHELDKINDGDQNLGTIFQVTAGTTFEIAVTFGSAFILELIKMRGGPNDDETTTPAQIKVYLGDSSTGTLLKTFSPSYTFSNYWIVNTDNGTLYTLVVTAGAKAYTGIFEIEMWGDPPDDPPPSMMSPTPTPTATGCYRIPEETVATSSHGSIPVAIIVEDCCYAITWPGCNSNSGTTVSLLSDLQPDFDARANWIFSTAPDLSSSTIDAAMGYLEFICGAFVDPQATYIGSSTINLKDANSWTLANFKARIGTTGITSGFSLGNIADGLRQLWWTMKQGGNYDVVFASGDPAFGGLGDTSVPITQVGNSTYPPGFSTSSAAKDNAAANFAVETTGHSLDGILADTSIDHPFGDPTVWSADVRQSQDKMCTTGLPIGYDADVLFLAYPGLPRNDGFDIFDDQGTGFIEGVWNSMDTTSKANSSDHAVTKLLPVEIFDGGPKNYKDPTGIAGYGMAGSAAIMKWKSRCVP